MDNISRAIDLHIERQFGWLRRAEIGLRAVACAVAVGTAVSLVLGLWQPSAESAAQWMLALVLLWGAAHMLRSLLGAWGQEPPLRRGPL